MNNAFWFIAHKFTGCLECAGTVCESIVIENNDPAGIHAAVKEMQTVQRGLIQIDVYVHQAKARLRYDIQYLWYPALVYFYIGKVTESISQLLRVGTQIPTVPFGVVVCRRGIQCGRRGQPCKRIE